MDWNQIALISSTFITIITAVWGLAIYQSKQFTSVRTLVYNLVDKLEDTIIKKLEYHEKHDDQRFNQIRDDIWILRVHNASKGSLDNVFKKRNGHEEESNSTK